MCHFSVSLSLLYQILVCIRVLAASDITPNTPRELDLHKSHESERGMHRGNPRELTTTQGRLLSPFYFFSSFFYTSLSLSLSLFLDHVVTLFAPSLAYAFQVSTAVWLCLFFQLFSSTPYLANVQTFFFHSKQFFAFFILKDVLAPGSC